MEAESSSLLVTCWPSRNSDVGDPPEALPSHSRRRDQQVFGSGVLVTAWVGTGTSNLLGIPMGMKPLGACPPAPAIGQHGALKAESRFRVVPGWWLASKAWLFHAGGDRAAGNRGCGQRLWALPLQVPGPSVSVASFHLHCKRVSSQSSPPPSSPRAPEVLGQPPGVSEGFGKGLFQLGLVTGMAPFPEVMLKRGLAGLEWGHPCHRY